MWGGLPGTKMRQTINARRIATGCVRLKDQTTISCISIGENCHGGLRSIERVEHVANSLVDI